MGANPPPRSPQGESLEPPQARRVFPFLFHGCFVLFCAPFNAPPPDTVAEENPWDSQRIILAVFLGGCTFSEISALRFLGKERGTGQSRAPGAGGGGGWGACISSFAGAPPGVTTAASGPGQTDSGWHFLSPSPRSFQGSGLCS